jgi:hypothetical protein
VVQKIDRGPPYIFIGYSSIHAANVRLVLAISKHAIIQKVSIVPLNLSHDKTEPYNLDPKEKKIKIT